MIEAAGGVVWRRRGGTGERDPKGRIEVLVVHRPRYDDWSFPKGKLEPGETAVDGALREVDEETGWCCVTGPVLPEVRYTDRKGRPKRVRYWAMEPRSGAFEANDEVDEIRWVTPDEAAALLTYDHDMPVLDAFRRLGETAG